MKKTWMVLGALAVAGVAQADIEYVVTISPEPGSLHVTMYVPNTERGSRFQIPNWAPGAYRLTDNFNNVKNLKATDPSGRELKIDTEMRDTPLTYGDAPNRQTIQNKICTWVVAGAKSTRIDYDITLASINNVMHWSGPSTYLYEADRKDEKCTLEVNAPADWKVYTGLDEMTFRKNTFYADDYDVLADNPVTAGSNLLVDTYVSRGKPHTIVMRGTPKDKVNREYLIKACKFVSDMQTDFFGGAPFNKYVWHFAVNDAEDGAGGLEHLSSTQITLARGVGPRAVSVLSHEYFHLWNVKRIRTKVLGPFDYTKLPKTGGLWWLEGVTDYYAHYLLVRYGWWEEKALLDDILSNTNAVRRTSAYTEVSPHETSYRVDEASNGRGNSNGWRLSYYNQGWLCGMVLDLELRSRTNGKYSLDDVTRALWAMTKDNQPGFAEDEIRKQCVRFGGPEMGAFYDRVVMKPGDMALEETLAKAGLVLATKQEEFLDYGFTWGPGRGENASVSVRNVSGAGEGKLVARDQIISVNGVKLEGENSTVMAAQMTKIMDALKAGDAIRLSIMRENAPQEVELKVGTGKRPVVTLEKATNATAAQKKLRDGWLARRAFRP